MPAHRNLTRENEVRRLQTRRKNDNKVLLGFIKKTYPRVHGEAMKFMEALREEYPDKIDLSKTKSFWDMINTEAAGKNTEAAGKNTEAAGKNIRATTKAVSLNAVRLRIKLGEYTSTTQGSAAEVPEQTVVDEQATPQSETVTVVDEGTVPDATLSLMDEATLNGLMEELREDPMIADFFNQIEWEHDNCPLW